MTKVFVTGASGNVGTTIVRWIQDKPDFELAGGYCREAGEDLGLLAGIGELGVKAAADLDAGLTEAKPDVVIDFSATPILKQNLETYLRHDLNVVVGTTGLTDEDLAPFKAEVARKGLRWAAIPNYGLGHQPGRRIHQKGPPVLPLRRHHRSASRQHGQRSQRHCRAAGPDGRRRPGRS